MKTNVHSIAFFAAMTAFIYAAPLPLPMPDLVTKGWHSSPSDSPSSQFFGVIQWDKVPLIKVGLTEQELRAICPVVNPFKNVSGLLYSTSPAGISYEIELFIEKGRVSDISYKVCQKQDIPLPLHAGWVVRPDSNMIAYSTKQGEGYESFDEALKALADDGRIQKLDAIAGISLFPDEALQQEIFADLERNAPEELKEAQQSAGNMHNPKMHKLWKPFEKALLATSTITKLNTSLAAYGLTISRAGVEKFELRATLTDANRRFHGILWLYVTKLE